LDHFKDINDTLGHHYGDLILRQVALRLNGSLRESDTVARFGGDEFAILLPVIESHQYATRIAKKIIGAMERPLLIEDQTFHVGVSIGVAIFPDHGTDNVTLMRHADVAMYTAKRNGNEAVTYEPSQDQHSQNRLALMGELRHAIEHEELLLYYQPKVEIKGEYVTEVEALVRWQHPNQGFMMPDKFIPFAEQTGLIISLTLWVIKEAIRQCSTWHRKGYLYKVAINLSARNLHDTQLPDYIHRVMQMYEIDPEWLVIEITESAIMSDPIRAMEVLTRLHDMGIRLSIDDFGTGYSSLSYLKQLPVDEIKIDKSFVADMAKNKDDLVIVRSTIDLAHNMGRKVIAEGVNTPEIWDMLVNLGCDMAQGFYICEPLPPVRLKQWLHESHWLHAKTPVRKSN
ncbi:MAG TPA: bifunctional diguanylate cyclase/phosphodiesterase, partial [Gammaproteobacteria bacterium]